jgi:hypothetical protein
MYFMVELIEDVPSSTIMSDSVKFLLNSTGAITQHDLADCLISNLLIDISKSYF